MTLSPSPGVGNDQHLILVLDLLILGYVDQLEGHERA